MVKLKQKNSGEWLDGEMSQKQDDSYVATRISVRDNGWKGGINNFTFSVTVPTATTLALTGLEANSFSGGKALRAVQISDNIETDLSVNGSTVTFTPGTYKVRIEMRKNSSSVEQSVAFPVNSIITSIDDVSGYRGSVFPRTTSSTLVAVPDYLPESITSLAFAFRGCTSFNQELNWDTSNVTNMSYMFTSCGTFNQPVNFDTSNVTNMSEMFYGCLAFNQPVNFDTSKVTSMSYMFFSCVAFNQNISTWDVTKVTSWANFRTGSGLSITNTPPKFR